MRQTTNRTFGMTTASLATALVITATVGIAPASAATAEGGQWAVLGDSYTAGFFAGEQLEPEDGCMRTSGSYPVLAHRAARPDLELVNVSCVAAETSNVWDPQTPAGGGEAVAPQIEALSDRTEVVTIGLGGNSMGFGELLERCLVLGIGAVEKPGAPCTSAYGADVGSGSIGSDLEARLAAVGEEYGRMLADVRRAAPNAQVVVVGYPQLAPADPQTCTWKSSTQFSFTTRADLPFFRLVEERLNTLQSALAVVHGAEYVDLASANEGEDVCADPATRWIEGLQGADGSNTLVHPNERGHAAAAELVAAAVRD
ncbi:SGNH/GDSL hydrolase family protein [Curtobacterium pusillum]|uniref:SGNH/GDSL hydrolase family protein n=1 Tax=Curtobacterium pusillum TaxID=69373 RepID=UPI0011A931A4|nr:SGNH/GDSL hydrolase family protein [Curtobacterium pusillum]